MKIKLNTIVVAKIESMKSHADFLGYVASFWVELCSAMQSIRGIFNFLERTVLLKEDLTLWDVVLSQVKEAGSELFR